MEIDLDAILTWLGELSLADWIRMAVWAFPIVNIAHVIGIALLFGGIVALDLQLLGVGGREIALGPLARLILPSVLVGFGLAVATGGLMFMANPREYWANPYFSWKFGLIAAAGLNALVLHTTAWRNRKGWAERAPLSVRAAGLVSLGL
jgi:hypothetical protein